MGDDVVNVFADEFEHPPGETLVRAPSGHRRRCSFARSS